MILYPRGSVSLSVQPEGQGRSEPPKIAWGSDIFSRSGRDRKARSSAKLNSHTSSESYSMSRPLLCTESETDVDGGENPRINGAFPAAAA